MVTDISKVFLIDVYALLDPGGTFCFVTPYVSMEFYILPKVSFFGLYPS